MITSFFKKILIFLFIFSVVSLPLPGAERSKYDVVVLAPHPDDAVISCAGTIAEFIKTGKSVAVVFFTNGEAGLALPEPSRKNKLAFSDILNIGKKRQKEAVEALTSLGVGYNSIFFLSYPDRGLMPIWKKEYAGKYYSVFSGRDYSPFVSYGKAQEGYTKQNIINDLAALLNKLRPSVIYTPHLQDAHPDHKAATLFLYAALRNLADKYPPESKWIWPVDIRYYTVHSSPKRLSGIGLMKKDISSFWKVKQKALRFYKESMRCSGKIGSLLNAKEESYYSYRGIKNILSQETGFLSRVLHKDGYNMTMSIVADIDDPLSIENPVSLKERIFSNNRRVVSEIGAVLCKGYNKNNILPVLKHFPGLKKDTVDTHSRLCSINLPLKQVKDELLPYKRLLGEKIDFAIMINQAVYPEIDSRPAVISRRIINDLARGYLKFQGLLITDELSGMGSLKDFYIKKYGHFDIIKAVADSFNAGADIITMYLSRDNFKQKLTEILDGVEKALYEGELNKKQFERSVKRILKIKRKILHCETTVDALSLREQIAQRFLLEIYTKKQMETASQLGVGAIHLRYPRLLGNAYFKVPPFTACLLEGGEVFEKGIDFNIESALTRGFEYERLIKNHFSKRGDRQEYSRNLSQKPLDATSVFKEYESIISKRDFAVLAEKNFRNFPIYIDNERLKFKSYRAAPFEWIKRFKSEKQAELYYYVLKGAFCQWERKFDFLNNLGDFKAQLASFLKYLRQDKRFYIRRPHRVLCLAAHPDEEDAGLIAYLKDNFSCQVYILYATGGEGGEDFLPQKLTSKLLFTRVLEGVKAAKKLGAEGVYFLGMPDFGYTSSEKEVKKYWRMRILRNRLGYFLLNIQPDIIITRNTPFDSHSQNRVFIKTAGDVINTLIKKKMLIVKHFWQRAGSSHYDVSFCADKRGKNNDTSYNQLAFEVLKFHRSQGSFSFQREGRTYGGHSLFYRDLLHNGGSRNFMGETLPVEDRVRINISSFPGVKVVPRTKILLVGRDYNLKAVLYMLGFFDVDVCPSRRAKSINWDDYDTVVFSPMYFQSKSTDWLKAEISNFINRKGNVVILNHYDVNSNLKRLVSGMGPMVFSPIENESSPFRILKPSDCFFKYPNKIGKEIFEGWVKQRTLFMPENYDRKRFQSPASFYDKNRNKWAGSLLLVSKGERGRLVVSCLDFEKQLFNLHKGVLKFFANCLSKPQEVSYGRQ